MKFTLCVMSILIMNSFILPQAQAKPHKAKKAIQITFTEQDLRHSRNLASTKTTANDPEFAATARLAQREKDSMNQTIPEPSDGPGVF